jgi:hypothetical protein
LRGLTAGDDLFSSVCVCGGSRAFRNNNTDDGMVASVIDKRANVVGRLSEKRTNKVMYRQVASLDHKPSHFEQKLCGVNM